MDKPGCQNCDKGPNGRNCCPMSHQMKTCPVHEPINRQPANPDPVPEQTIALSRVPAQLVPSLIKPEIAALTERILRAWELPDRKQIANDRNSHHRFAIVVRNNPALAPLFARYKKKLQMLAPDNQDEDMQYVSWSLMMIVPDARREYEKWCEQVEEQYSLILREKSRR